MKSAALHECLERRSAIGMPRERVGGFSTRSFAVQRIRFRIERPPRESQSPGRIVPLVVAPGYTSSILLAASHGQLGEKSDAREVWREFLERRPDLAADPIGHLRRAFFREDSVARVVEGLRIAGIELE